MGRFSDGGKYPSDIVKGTLSKVANTKLTKRSSRWPIKNINKISPIIFKKDSPRYDRSGLLISSTGSWQLEGETYTGERICVEMFVSRTGEGCPY